MSEVEDRLHQGRGVRGDGRVMFDYARLRTDLLALAVLAVAVFLGLSLASYDPADPPALSVYPTRAVAQNLGGQAGAMAAHTLIVTMGVGAYFLLVALIVADIRLFARDHVGDATWRLVGAALMLVAVCVAGQWFRQRRLRRRVGRHPVGRQSDSYGECRAADIGVRGRTTTHGRASSDQNHVLYRTAADHTVEPSGIWAAFTHDSRSTTVRHGGASALGTGLRAGCPCFDDDKSTTDPGEELVLVAG